MTERSQPAARPLPGPASPIAAAVLAGALVWAAWWALVTHRGGQLLETLALEGSHIGDWRLDDQADSLLATVSVPMVAVIIAVVLIIGVLRGRWLAGVAAAVAVVGANVTTQVLKSQVLQRDDLLGLGVWNGTNTLPSGHTTVAAAALVGLLLVVPPTMRSLTTAFGVVAVSAYGLATLINSWHRPSDVAAAVLVASGWGYLAVAVIRLVERRAGQREVPHRPGGASVVLVMFAICALALSVAAGYLSWGIQPATADPTTAAIAYVAGIAAVLGVTCGGLGALLRLLDATRPAPREKSDASTAQPATAAPVPPA